MRRFSLTRSAQADLKSIARYTQSQWGIAQRNAYLKEMDKAFNMLARDPLMGKSCDEVLEGYRKLPHGAHIIYYKQPSENKLIIIRILHASMDVDSNIGA